MPYNEYLQSEYWKQVKLKILKRDGLPLRKVPLQKQPKHPPFDIPKQRQ